MNTSEHGKLCHRYDSTEVGSLFPSFRFSASTRSSARSISFIRNRIAKEASKICDPISTRYLIGIRPSQAIRCPHVLNLGCGGFMSSVMMQWFGLKGDWRRGCMIGVRSCLSPVTVPGTGRSMGSEVQYRDTLHTTHQFADLIACASIVPGQAYKYNRGFDLQPMTVPGRSPDTVQVLALHR